MDKLLELINRKIAEHRYELAQTGDYKTELKKKIIAGRELVQSKSPKVAETAMQILALNDKVAFHEACLKCLDDLKKDLVSEV